MCNTVGNVFRLVILGGVGLGLTMQFFTTFSCEFLNTSTGTIGIWYIEDETGVEDCVEFDSEDSYVLGARSALTISTVAGFGAGVLILFEWLLCAICCAGCVEGLALASAWMVGGATFMVWAMEECGNLPSNADESVELQGSSNDCEWGTAATFMTVACAAYLAAGFLLCCAPQPDPICKQ